jgi:hypothetical protein
MLAPTETPQVSATQVPTIPPSATVRESEIAAPKPTVIPPSATLLATNTPEPIEPNTPTPISTPSALVPTFINHSPPSYTVDFSVYEQSNDLNTTLDALGCDEIQKPADLLGALQPAYPVALCFVEPYLGKQPEPPQGSYLYRTGGLRGMYARYVIWRDGQFELLRNPGELAAIYAPIESPDEALALATAATGLDPAYNLKYEPDYEYFVSVVEDTFTRPDGDGYLVRLYYFVLFGCGPHQLLAFDIHVTPDGVIEQRERTAVYQDHAMDNLCVD